MMAGVNNSGQPIQTIRRDINHSIEQTQFQSQKLETLKMVVAALFSSFTAIKLVNHHENLMPHNGGQAICILLGSTMVGVGSAKLLDLLVKEWHHHFH